MEEMQQSGDNGIIFEPRAGYGQSCTIAKHHLNGKIGSAHFELGLLVS